MLWEDERPASPERNVATMVSRLRKVLGTELIQGGRAGYRLAARPERHRQPDAAAGFCEQAEGELGTAAAVALAAAERAHELLSAGTAIGEEHYADWADPAREQVRELLRRVRLAAAEAALATGDPRRAASYAEAAVAADPLDEAAHAGTCRRRQGRRRAGAGRLRGATAAARPRARRQPGPADAGAAPGDPARAEAARPERVRPGGASGTEAGAILLAGRDRETRRSGRRGPRPPAEPGLVTITGEAGIGKTALAEALAAEAADDGGTVLRTRCYETERSLFLQPIVEAIAPVAASIPAGTLRQLLGEHATAAAGLLPEVAALLGPPPPGRGSMEMERRRAFEAVRAFLRGLAERNPVLLLVDDLQYAGQSTVELMHFLGREPAGTRLLVLATVRAENDAQVGAALAPVARRVWAGPLDPDAVAQLARAAGRGELAGRILEQTRGHTLFVVEVLRALASGEEGVPESLRTAVQARVRRAGPGVEALLRAAAVLGATVDPLTVGVMLDLVPTTALELCEAAFGARLLVVSGRDYEFANDLIREVLYASTPEPTRLAYHRRAADLLTGQPESLARHAAAAGDWLRAGRAWLRAGEEAMGRYAASDALALATQALEAGERADDLEVSARALVLRGRALEATGAHAAALEDLTRGAEGARAAGDRRLEMLALRELGGDVPVSRGKPAGYYAANLESGLRIAESLGDRGSEAHMLNRLAIIAANRLRLDAGVSHGLRAVAAGRAAGDDQALAAGLDGLKIAYLSLGDTHALAGVLAELKPLLRRLGDLFRLPWAEFEGAFLAIAVADWDDAVQAIGTGIEANRQGGYPHRNAWYAAHLGWIARLRGRDDEAVTLGRQALARTERYQHPWWRAATSAMLGGTLLLAGDWPGAIGCSSVAWPRPTVGVEAYMLRCAAPLAAATGSAAMLDQAAGLLGRPASGRRCLGAGR